MNEVKVSKSELETVVAKNRVLHKEQFDKAFAIRLQRFDYPGGTYRGYSGPVRLPPALDGIVEAVLGLDDRPQARSRAGA